jgi:hypothetical protein
VAGIDRDQVSFELERFELVGNDRLEVTGRWYGVRGRRFVRPSLTVPAPDGGHRSLALLDHKPWSADDGAAWVAAFPWRRNQHDVIEVELAVAPDITVCLPGPTSSGAPQRAKRQPGLTAKRSARRGGERPAADSRPRAGSSRLAEKAPPVKQGAADARRVAAERDAAREELTTARTERDAAREELTTARTQRDAAREELTTAQTERDAARAELTTARTERDTATTHAAASWRRLEIMTKRYQRLEQEHRATREERQRLANELEAASAERDSLLAESRSPALELGAARASPRPPRTTARPRGNLAPFDLPPSDRIELSPPRGSSWAARALAITALLAIVVILLLMLS